MLGKLYVHVSDQRRFLLVRRENSFPFASFDPDKWRVLAIGVEPVSDTIADDLQQRGFAEYRSAAAA